MMTPEEAWEAGLPGTYMNGTYFPAPFCLRCLSLGHHEHPGCVWQYWSGLFPDRESPDAR